MHKALQPPDPDSVADAKMLSINPDAEREIVYKPRLLRRINQFHFNLHSLRIYKHSRSSSSSSRSNTNGTRSSQGLCVDQQQILHPAEPCPGTARQAVARGIRYSYFKVYIQTVPNNPHKPIQKKTTKNTKKPNSKAKLTQVNPTKTKPQHRKSD